MHSYLCASIPILRVESNDMDSTRVQNGMCRRSIKNAHGGMKFWHCMNIHPPAGIFKKLGINYPKQFSIQPPEEA